MITPLQPRTGLPAGYPFDYERRLDLADGRSVHVRPVVPGDAVLLGEAVAEADTDTLYQRFFNPAIRIDQRRLRHLTELDYEHRFAVAAFADGDGVAIARFEPAGEHKAEVAVVVKPGWRRVGLATALFELIEHAAIERGVRQLEALYLADNHAIKRVLEKRGFGGIEIQGGVARVVKAIGGLPAEAPAAGGRR